IMLRDLSDQRVKEIIEALASKPQKAGSIDAKISDYYNAYMDTDAIDRAGLEPLKPFFAQVDGAADRKALFVLMGNWQGVIDTPVGLQVLPDFKDPTIYAPLTWQGGLGLPDRDYYLKDSERFAKARTAYITYLTTLYTLSGDKHAATHATAVMALE